MNSSLLKNIFFTEMPDGEIPKAYMQKAGVLATHYINRNIPLPNKGGHKTFILIRNRFLNLLLDGTIPFNTTSINLYVTEEMKLVLCREIQAGTEESGDYFVAFLSYRIQNFLNTHYCWVKDTHDYEDLVSSLYENFLLLIKKANLSVMGIPDSYLYPNFKGTVLNSLRMRDAFTKDRNCYSTVETIRNSFPDELASSSTEDIIIQMRTDKRKKDIPASYVEAARYTVYSVEDQLAREHRRDGACISLLPPVHDDYRPIYDEEIMNLTFSLARNMDGSLSITDITVVINLLLDYFDDEKHTKKLSVRKLRECARRCNIKPAVFEMVMNCFVSTLQREEVVLSIIDPDSNK